jgi:septal ring factor EnvC (AmiA/AmiB activator)
MRQKAEKAAAELAETLRREKTSRGKVGEIEGRIARQRRLIASIDRRLSALGGRMDRAEREIRALDLERSRTQRGLAGSASEAFSRGLSRPGAPWEAASRERERDFARRILAAELVRYGRLTADREEKGKELSDIERRLEDSERRMKEQKRVGAKLASQQEAERRRLEEIGKKKKEKEKELRALRARIARMESLVSRIEREMKRKDAGRKGPRQFSGVPGGLVPPLAGKVVVRYGKNRDPVFDVDVESRGVEIEAASGAVIHSVGKGEVVFAGSVSGFGKVLIVQHGSGLFSVYGKADSFAVKQGQAVSAGQAVGRLPASPDGKSVLYLELRAAGTAIDPAVVIPLSR